MRKLLLSLILILGTLCSNANIIELANYQDGFGRERSINLVLKDDKPSSIIIPCEKEDGSLGYVLQPIDYLFSIQTYIEELRQKYIEWTQTAVSNGIEEYEKKFAASGYLYGFIWYNPNKRFGSSEFNAVWKYGKDSNIVEITAKVVDTSGSYEIADFSITFSCQNDFDLLLNAISTSNIQSHIPISTDSLFQ